MESLYFHPHPEFTKTPLLTGDSPESPPAYDQESSISDCESGVSSSSTLTRRRRCPSIFPEAVAPALDESDRVYEVIRRRFVTCLGVIGDRTEVGSIRRRSWSTVSAQASLQTFQVHSRALAKKHGGCCNVKFGWYGSSKERIMHIINHGFGYSELRSNDNGAVYLCPDDSPLTSVEETIPDEDGMRHVLLCRVILGQPEWVKPESGQTQPSSEEYDSGMDDLVNPNKYIIWSSNMNSHILPEYIVSFKVSDPVPTSSEDMNTNTRMPTSPWMSFPVLISILAKYLPHNAISLINKFHKDYKERKMTRRELIQKVRQIAGDKLLVTVIKSCRGAKGLKTSMCFLRNRNSTNQK